MENKLTENEIYEISCDFIKRNSDITNVEVPLCFLEFWVDQYIENNEPSSLPFRIFRYILELDFNTKENVSIYKSYQLLHIFQIIVATTIDRMKNRLPLCTIQLFRIDKYHIPKIEKHEQLYIEYVKFVTPSAFTNRLLRHKTERFNNLSKFSVASKLSNLKLIELFIREEFDYAYSNKSNMFERMNQCILAAVKHAILYVNKDENKRIQVIFKTHCPHKIVTILCGGEKRI